MDAKLRAHITNRLRQRLSEDAPQAVRVEPAPTSELEVYNFLPRDAMHVYAGIKIAAITDRFFGVVAWSNGSYPILESVGLPFASFDDLTSGSFPRRSILGEGAIRLDLFAGRRIRNYDVNIAAVEKEDDEYKQWMARTVAHPTWQGIMTPRATKYTDEVVSDLIRFVVPFSRIVAGNTQ
jgi:hypothetical protein